MMCLTIVVVVIMCLSIVYSDGCYDVSLVYNGRLCYDVSHCSVHRCAVLQILSNYRILCS